MEVSEIKDRDSFEAWLEDKPIEWAQVIAARIALRAAPMAWAVAALPDERLAKDHSNNLILSTFRACCISSAGRKHPVDDIRDAAADAANAAGAAADAAYAAYAANAAVDSVAYASVNAAFIAALAADAADAVNANTAAFAVANAASADVATNWEVIRADCAWLEAVAEGNYDDSVTKAQALSNEPLWMKLAAPETLPGELKQKFHDFSESELAQTTSFGLITDWYRSVLQGKKGFLTSSEKKIALMPKEDWEGDPVEVMDRVAAIAGWSDNYKKQNYSTDVIPKSETSMRNNKPTSTQINVNRTAVHIQIASILVSIKTEREALGAIPNDEEKLTTWEKQKEFLNNLEIKIDEVAELLPNVPDNIAHKTDEEVAEKFLGLADEFTKWIKENKPEMVDWTMRLGSATSFIGMMGFLGASMPIATSVVLAMTCGPKARDIIMGNKKEK